MYTNPLMRGFIKLENELQSTTINVEDNGSNQLEIKIKLTLCDIMDRFLNMRQNYLMLNILSFFKKSIIEKMDEGIASVKITKENENLFSGYSSEDADKLKL
jgi:inositol 1,4,5-triphosphate receptor type 1/inositol 1,4,5-triphosphate receptor type 3